MIPYLSLILISKLNEKLINPLEGINHHEWRVFHYPRLS